MSDALTAAACAASASAALIAAQAARARPSEMAGHAERAQLAALRTAVAGVSTQICREVAAAVMVKQHQVLGALLRKVATNGLDAATAAQVGAQIDAALSATRPSGSFKPPEIKVARDEKGCVEFRCSLDTAAVDVSVKGEGYSAASAQSDDRPPQLHAFTAIVSGVPSPTPTYLLPAAPPAPAPVVNVNQAATKQVIERDEDGEIKTISTVVQ